MAEIQRTYHVYLARIYSSLLLGSPFSTPEAFAEAGEVVAFRKGFDVEIAEGERITSVGLALDQAQTPD